MSGPTKSLYVETQALYECAEVWRGVAVPKLDLAQTQASHGEGQGYLFGVLLGPLQQPHDTFVTSATTILGSGSEVAGGFGDALEEVAKDYESTDANTSTLMTKAEAGL